VGLSDVVDANIPFISSPVKDMGEPAGDVVAFEDENPLFCVPGQECGGGKSADAGTDDDRVPGFVERKLSVICEVHSGTSNWTLGDNVALVNIGSGTGVPPVFSL
jgi:hypothetical protein